jgi:sec-independent protein translocase protein TatB
MFNIGFWELFIIVIVGLLLVGPKQLPDIARTVGKALRKLRRTGDELRDSARKIVEEVVPRDALYGEDEYRPPPPPSYTPLPVPEKKTDGEEPKSGDSDLAV